MIHDAGLRDYAVDASGRVDRLAQGGRPTSVLRHTALLRHHARAELDKLGSCLPVLVGAAPPDHQIAPRARDAPRKAKTDPRVAARDQNNFTAHVPGQFRHKSPSGDYM